MTTPVRITHPDTVHDVGDIVEVSDDRAARLIAIGYAAPVTDGGDDSAEAPAQSALKSEWVDYVATHHGVPHDEAEAMTKAELVESFG